MKTSSNKQIMRFCNGRIVFLSILFSFSCVFIYDPKKKVIDIENQSSTTILVSTSFSDSLPFSPELKLVPHFEILSSLTGQVFRPKFDDKNKKLNIFFLTDSILLNNSWEEIYRKQLFVKRYTFAEEELEKMKWKIIYK